MVQYLGIGLLAGLVSALLFAMLLKATALAILLYLLAPLPILIVGLGWSHKAALAAAVAGALALALGISPFLGIGFAIYLALPAWWLAYLAMLGRPEADGSLEWYPTGRLLAWIAGTAALAFVAIAVVAAPNYETFRAQLSSVTKRVMQAQMQGRTTPRTPSPLPSPGNPGATPSPDREASPTQESPPVQDTQPGREPPPASDAPTDLQNEVADALVTIAPGLAAQGLAILLTFYLWLAARIVQVSGRLPRPWPDIPSTAMPRAVLGVFAVSIALAMAPGYPGVLGVALIGALSAAFALQGLAAFHDRSRGRPARGALLLGLYVILFLTQGVALVALTLFGIADTMLANRTPAPPSRGAAH